MFYKGVQNVIFKKLVYRRQHTILALETFNSGVCDAAVDCRLSTSSRRFNCNAAKHKPTRFKQAGNHFHTQRRVNVKSKAGGKMGWRLPYNAQIVLNFLYACSCRQPSIVSVYRAGLNQFKGQKVVVSAVFENTGVWRERQVHGILRASMCLDCAGTALSL